MEKMFNGINKVSDVVGQKKYLAFALYREGVRFIRTIEVEFTDKFEKIYNAIK